MHCWVANKHHFGADGNATFTSSHYIGVRQPLEPHTSEPDLSEARREAAGLKFETTLLI